MTKTKDQIIADQPFLNRDQAILDIVNFLNDADLNKDYPFLDDAEILQRAVDLINDDALTADVPFIMNMGKLLQRVSQDINVDMIVAAIGQSLQDRLFTAFSGAGDDAFQAELANYYSGTITHTDAADTNQYLTKSSYDASGNTGGRYFWDDDTSEGAKGLKYTSLIDPVSNKSTYSAIFIDLGQSDGVNASFPHSQADYEAKWTQFLTQLNSDFPNAKIYLNLLNRTTQSGDFDSTYNLVRQTQLNLINSLSYVYRGIDCYDLEMTDNFHFIESDTEVYGEREARVLALVEGKISTGAYGPDTSNYSLIADEITFDVDHDAGTDWTAPSSGNGGFGVEDDGTAISVDSVSKTNASSGLIVLGEGEAPLHGSTVEGFVNYGDGGALGADPDVAMDNATNALPFRTKYGISVTNNDAVAALDNIEFRVHARGCAKTYSSSNIIEDITALEGSNFSEKSAGNGPEFTTNYIEFADTGDGLISDDVLTTSAARTVGICAKMPASIPSFGTILGFTNAAGAWSNNARMYIHTGGYLNYAAVDSGGTALHSSGAFSGSEDVIIFLRFNDETELEAFVNSKTVTATLDPQGTYAAADKKIGLGEASNQTGFALLWRIYDMFCTSDAISDQELSDIYDQWESKFSLSL